MASSGQAWEELLPLGFWGRRIWTGGVLRWPEAEGRDDVLAGLPGTCIFNFVGFMMNVVKTLEC